MRMLARYFLQGCLVTVPVVLTIYAVYVLAHEINALLVPLPGLGIVLSLVGITAIGALASNVLGRTLVRKFERLIGRVPLVRLLYTTARDLLQAFFGDERSFDRPAVVALTADGETRAVGFITREALPELGMPDHVLVYFPQASNFAGNVLAFPREREQPLDVDAARVMALVVSGGVVTGRPAGESVRPPAP